MRIRFVVACAAVAISGCTSYRTVPIDNGADIRTRSYELVSLRLADGRTVRAESVRLDVDSTSWVDPVTREVRAVPTVEVLWVDRVRRVRGAVQGAAASFVVAAALGTIASRFGNRLTGSGGLPSALGTGAKVGLVAGSLGAAAGAAVGARERSAFTVGSS